MYVKWNCEEIKNECDACGENIEMNQQKRRENGTNMSDRPNRRRNEM